jgi:hypothetical protein
MKFLSKVGLFFLIFLLLSNWLLARDYFKCIDVIDGETIVIEINSKPVQVKLIGMNTPEAIYPAEPFEYIGIRSLSFVKKMFLGKRVRLEYDSMKEVRPVHLTPFRLFIPFSASPGASSIN